MSLLVEALLPADHRSASTEIQPGHRNGNTLTAHQATYGARFQFASSVARGAAAWLYDNGVQGGRLTHLQRFLTEARTQARRDGQDCFAFTVCIERERPDFDIPNSHHDGDDGRYWNMKVRREGRKVDTPFKLGMVFLGPGTVFYQTDEEQSHLAVSNGRKEKEVIGWSEDDIRRWLDGRLAMVSKVSLKVGEVAKWRVGNDGRGAIHSEPKMSPMPEGRVFVSLVPGTRSQIETYAANWGIPFNHRDMDQRCN